MLPYSRLDNNAKFNPWAQGFLPDFAEAVYAIPFLPGI
jgi:hypothetical protein